MTARTQTADLLKGIAVLLMIQVHIIELFATTGIYNSSFGKILLFCGGSLVAPVFMIILGYFIAASKKSLMQLIIRGVKIICLGMFLNIALNFNLILSVNKGLFQIDLLPYIFGVDILQFAGISIIIIAILKKMLQQSLIFVIVCIVISAFLGHVLSDHIPENTFLKYISAFFYGSCKWSYFPLFPWIAYPLSGIAFYQLTQHYDLTILNRKTIKIVLGILFLLFSAFTINYAISISSDLPSYYHHGVLFFLWTILFLSFYTFFINEIDKLIGKFILLKYLKWLGKNVTIIYIIQWIIIGNTATEIYKTVSSWWYLLIYFLVILFISSCAGYLSIKTKDRFIKKTDN